MGKFADWYLGNNDREAEPPKGGIKRIGYVLWNYAGKLVIINLLFLLCCIPIITIPAALSALNRYIGKIFRLGYGFSISEYWEEFKGGILKCLPLGLLPGAVLFYAYYLLSLAGNFIQESQRNVVLGIGIGVLVIGIWLGSWMFVLTSMVELPRRHILKNAVILMLAEWKRSFILAAETILYWGLVLALAPWSLFWVIIIGMSLQQLVVCALLVPAVKERVTDPYERVGGHDITVPKNARNVRHEKNENDSR